MGTWGIGAFDNDLACDWAFELENEEDTGLVVAAFENVLAVGSEYLDADAASEGLAAAEVVARLRGNWGTRNAYTEPVDQWVEDRAHLLSEDLVSQATAAIDRILTEPSELLELWTESEEFGRWHDAVRELKERVAG